MDVLIIDDEESVRRSTDAAIEAEGHYAETADSGQVGMLKLGEEKYDLVLLDLRLGDEDGLKVLDDIKKRYPDTPVVMFTAHATIRTAVEATQRGALDYLEKPFTPERLRQVLALAEKTRHLRDRIEDLEVQVTSYSPEPEFESKDPAMQGALEQLFRAAHTPATILLLGESGTGKSLVARALHRKSHLKDRPFVTVSCPSLSKELLESDLFGHVKGSFTGALKDTWGKVKAAEGGTLFLDEIGELPMEVQPKLLRLLQEREYERLGEHKTRTANVRIIAATNRNLAKQVEAGRFREDLFFRLNVITVEMPPLRARPSDLDHFANSYLRFFVDQFGRKVKGFSEESLAAIRRYEWPGNLRELRNSVERAVILSKGDFIELADLPDMIGSDGDAPAVSQIGGLTSLETLEREHIRLVLERTSTIQEAAAVLGIDQATLYRKRKKMGLQ